MSSTATSATSKRRRSTAQSAEPAENPHNEASNMSVTQPCKRSKQASSPSNPVASSSAGIDSVQHAAKVMLQLHNTVVIDEPDDKHTVTVGAPVQTMFDKSAKQFDRVERMIVRTKKALLKRISEVVPAEVKDMAVADLSDYIDHLTKLAYVTAHINNGKLLSDDSIDALLSYSIHPLSFSDYRIQNPCDALCQAVRLLAYECHKLRTDSNASATGASTTVSTAYNTVAMHKGTQVLHDYNNLQLLMPRCAAWHDVLLSVKLEAEQDSRIAIPKLPALDEHKQRCRDAQTSLINCINAYLPLWFNRIVSAEIEPILVDAMQQAAVTIRPSISGCDWSTIHNRIMPHLAPLDRVDVPAIRRACTQFKSALTTYSEQCLIKRSPALQLPLDEETFAWLARSNDASDVYSHGHDYLKSLLDYLSFNDIIQLRQVNRHFRALTASVTSFEQPLTISGKRKLGQQSLTELPTTEADDARYDRLVNSLFLMPPNSLRQCRWLIIDNVIPTAQTWPKSQKLIQAHELDRALHCVALAAPLLEKLVVLNSAQIYEGLSCQWAAVRKLPALQAFWLHYSTNYGSNHFRNWTNRYGKQYARSASTFVKVTVGGDEQVMKAVLSMNPSLLPQVPMYY